MKNLSQLTRQHYEKNEAGDGLVSKISKVLDSLPDGSVDSLRLAGLDQFHVMGLAATEQLAQRTRLAELVSYEIGDLSALPFRDSSFGVVWTQHVVMNIPERETSEEFVRQEVAGNRKAWATGEQEAVRE